MKKPAKGLFRKDQLRSISEVERRLAEIQEMQRRLEADGFQQSEHCQQPHRARLCSGEDRKQAIIPANTSSLSTSTPPSILRGR